MTYLGLHHYHQAPGFTYEIFREEGQTVFRVFERQRLPQRPGQTHYEYERVFIGEAYSYDDMVQFVQTALAA